MLLLQSFVGLALLIFLCLIFSESRTDIKLRIVGKSLLLQTVLALILLKLPASQGLFVFLNDGISVLQAATRAGTSFIFGYLGGDALPFQTNDQGDGDGPVVLSGLATAGDELSSLESPVETCCGRDGCRSSRRSESPPQWVGVANRTSPVIGRDSRDQRAAIAYTS